MVIDVPADIRRRDAAVQSVDRAVSILQLIAERGAAGVTEISQELGVHKSTAFRLLSTLEARGLVEQHIERGKYQIGYTAVQVANGASKVRDLAEIGRPICQELSLAVGETVSLAVPDGDSVITVSQTLGRAAVSSMDILGKGQDLHATAAGKVFLAQFSAAELEAFLAHELRVHTPSTITDPTTLRHQLAMVAEQGHATVFGEAELGLVAVAVPVRTLGRAVVAALVVAGPEFRVNATTIPGLLEHLKPAAAEISWRIGSVKPG